MPLLFEKYITPDIKVGVWEIDETEEWFIERLWLCREELLELEQLKSRKRLEWLADRYVLHHLIGEKDRFPCIKNELGKPFLQGSDFQISLSNSADKAAAMFGNAPLGLDIQYITQKIERIERKFMREEESDCLDSAFRLEHLHVFWGAKEALYKAYGKRELDFKKHILIEPFDFNLKNGKTKGVVLKDNYTAKYDIFYEKKDTYIIVYAVEIKL